MRRIISAIAFLCLAACDCHAQSLTKAQVEQTVQATIKANGQKQITGPILQTNLLNMLGIAATWGQGTWAPDVSYSSGEIVSYNSALWIGDVPVTGTAPGVTSGQWSLLSPAPGTGLAISGSNLNLQPAQASTIGGVESDTSTSHQWIAYIDSSGVPHQSQPAIGDLSGLGTGVAVTLGDAPNTNGAFITGSTSSIAEGAVNVGAGSGASIQGIADVATGSIFVSGGIGAYPGWSATGTGILSMLGNNVGSAGAPVAFNGAGGTPSSLVLTNATGLPPTGLSSLGSNTVLGNIGSGNAALTQAQLTALVNPCTAPLAGAVPTPPNSATEFLNGTCNWSTPAGGGGGGTVDNLLPNPQNQLASEFGWIAKQNQLGEASQTLVSCSAFQTSNPDPTFTCSNTQQLKTSDLVIVEETSGTPDNTFWTFPAVGSSFGCTGSGATHIVLCNNGAIASNRVLTVTANTSAQLIGNFSSESPASSVATFLQPIGIGDLGNSTNGFDGYTKTQTLNVWADDFAANSYPGQIRPLAMRKGAATSESYTFSVPLNKVGSYQGQTLSCGVEILSRGNAGTGDFTESITDSVNGTTTSSTLGSNASYQFVTVTHAIGANATSVSESINLTGASGDVYYAAKHTCAFVPSLTASQLHINSTYKIEATQHWNPPLGAPFVIGFPGTTCNVAGYYCFLFNDIEALSLGQAHSSLAAVDYKAEFTYSTPGAAFFTSGIFNGTTGQWNFAGPECVTQVANILTTCGGTLDLTSNETGFAFGSFSMIATVSAMAGENITYDFWNAYGGIGNAAD